MGNAILWTEIFGMITLANIIYGALFESKHRDRKKRAFIELVMSVFITLAIDGASYLQLDWTNHYSGHFALTLAAFISPLVVYAFFLRYIYYHVSGKAKISKNLFIGGVVYCGISILSSVYFGFKGDLFDLENGVYSPGRFYEGYLLTYVLILAYTFLLICIYRKKTGLHDAVAAVMFILIPMIFIIINLADSEMAFGVSALSLAMNVVNTMLQAEREHSLIESEKVSSQLAHADEMTGLQNRLAFTECCENIAEGENVGIIFADLNGLKYTNDNFGHKAGDALICKFAGILTGCFRKDDVFRISGDEFVVIVRNISEESFLWKSGSLAGRINSEDVPIASMGCIFGDENISELIEKAEAEMYSKKKIFHTNYPAYSRIS